MQMQIQIQMQMQMQMIWKANADEIESKWSGKQMQKQTILNANAIGRMIKYW